MSKTLKQEDITPELIIVTAERLGISLAPGHYRNVAKNCGCPVAVLAIDLDPDLRDESDGYLFDDAVATAGLSRGFTRGIIGGFDHWSDDQNESDIPGFPAGHAIGRATRIKVDPVFAKEVAA